MKAVMMNEFGGPEVLGMTDLETPAPGPGDVLVRVHAAGVNPVDWKMREGEYPPVGEDQLPLIPGRDMAGTIEAIGDEVAAWQPGDEVYAFLEPGLGGYSEYLVLSQDSVARKPGSLSMTEAAAVPLAAMTAWQGLFDHGGLERGQRVLILGGSGGVGHLAVQLAKARGAEVAATASGSDLDFLRQIGCDMPVAHDGARFEDVVKPVDVVLDLIGGETRDRAFSVVREGGIVVSTLGEPEARDGIGTAGFMAQPDTRELSAIARLIDEGQVRVEVQRVLPLDRAAEAQRLLREEHSRGKTVLEIR